MQTIVQLVAERAGISEQQAEAAVDTIAAFMKDRLPAPLAGQVEPLLKQDVGPYSEHLDTILKTVGGLFGGKKG